MISKSLCPAIALAVSLSLPATPLLAAEVARVTTISPFPRGLAVVDGDLYVLSRGRVRGAGGVSAEIADRAGTIFRIDTAIAQPVGEEPLSDAVRTNGEVIALPTNPPFRLWDVTANPPESDRLTDRPYAGLRWHEPTQSFYICAFSGVDKPRTGPGRSFSKNLTDAILRYDTRTGQWSEVERHNHEYGGIYPHHDPAYFDPPHGWLNGPNNLLPVGNWLYAVGKDNNALVRYDLSVYLDDPNAGPAPSEFFLGTDIDTTNAGPVTITGHSALAHRDGWLYLATRTSSHVVRLRMDAAGEPAIPPEIELLARFDPWDPRTLHSADLTDMAFDDEGRLYLVSAKPSRVYRFTPDPDVLFDARNGAEEPWRDFAALTGNTAMKSENILVHDGHLYITSGDGYAYQAGAAGTVYRTAIED